MDKYGQTQKNKSQIKKDIAGMKYGVLIDI